MIRRFLRRFLVAQDPAPARKPAPSAMERDALALAVATGVLAQRVPAWADMSEAGVRRRRLIEHIEVTQLQADAEGMEIAHHDLLLVSAKSGTHIPDVLALEATAYLTAEEIR